MTLVERCAARVPMLCGQVGWPSPSEVERLEGGSANLNFVARFAERAPLKLTFCLYKDRDGARQVAAALRALRGAPVGRLIEPVEGQSPIGDVRPVIVTAFTDGEPLAAVDDDTAGAFGRLLAAVHVPAPKEAAQRYDMHRDRLRAVAETHADAEFAAFLADTMAAVPPYAGLSHTLIHGDLFADNVIRTPDGALVAIDFEEACHGPRALDLAMCVVGFARSGDMRPTAVKALVDGYTAAASLTTADRAALPAMVDHAAAAVAGWRRIGAPDALDAGARDWREMRAVVDRNRAWLADGTWTVILG